MASLSILAGFLLIFYVIFLLIAIAAAVLSIIGLWKIFTKAGRHGWAAIIPFYSSYVLYDVGGFPPMLVFVNIGVAVIAILQLFFSTLLLFKTVDIVLPIISVFNALSFCGSIACFVLQLLAYMNIAKKFGKSAGFGVGMTFLPFIFNMILGFDKDAVYDENII